MNTKFLFLALIFATMLVSIEAIPRRSRHDSARLGRHRPRPNQSMGASANTSFFNVLDYGAIGDNSTDNTAAFQAALDAASTAHGGIVYAPTGLYYFSGTLTIPSAVTLQGSYMMVPSHDFVSGETLNDGTVLLATSGQGNSSEVAFITITENAALRGVVIYYPNQDPTQLPIEYPWTIYMFGDNAAITDVELLNSFNGIGAVGAHRHYIARIQGQPTNIGVFVDETYDIGRIEDVHFNPWYSINAEYMKWQTTNGRAFVMGRSDWEYVFNTFAFGYAIGYHFIETPTGSMNGNFLGIGSDLSVNHSIQVDASQASGLLITNGEFTAFHSSQFDPNATSIPSQVYISPTNSGPVHFVDSSFWGPTNHIAELHGTGTTSFASCSFVQWDLVFKNGSSAILATAGNIILNGNEFQQIGVQAELGSGVAKAVIIGNVFTGPEMIVNSAKKSEIGLNASD